MLHEVIIGAENGLTPTWWQGNSVTNDGKAQRLRRNAVSAL